MRTDYIKILSLLVSLSACSGGNNEEIVPDKTKASLSISTTIQTRSVVTSFKTGDKMNVYVKTGSDVGSADYKPGVTASYNGSTWNITPEVELQDDAYIFAYYPYMASADASNLQVTVSPQIDYLYSGNGVKVSGLSPNASLTMKHALPMIAFNIAKGNYIGDGKVTTIKISGEGIFTTGLLNVGNGEITGNSKGDYRITTSQTVETDGWKENFPQMFCLPFNSNGSNIMVTFTIDDQEMETVLPIQNVAGGMKYLFRLVLTQEGIMILPNETEIISLNKNIDEMPPANINEVKFSIKGKEVTLPELTGNSKITGMVSWGDDIQESYAAFLKHNYRKEDEYQIQLLSVGATAIEFKDLEQIEEIDLSNF